MKKLIIPILLALVLVLAPMSSFAESSGVTNSPTKEWAPPVLDTGETATLTFEGEIYNIVIDRRPGLGLTENNESVVVLISKFENSKGQEIMSVETEERVFAYAIFKDARNVYSLMNYAKTDGDCDGIFETDSKPGSLVIVPNCAIPDPSRQEM